MRCIVLRRARHDYARYCYAGDELRRMPARRDGSDDGLVSASADTPICADDADADDAIAAEEERCFHDIRHG